MFSRHVSAGRPPAGRRPTGDEAGSNVPAEGAETPETDGTDADGADADAPEIDGTDADDPDGAAGVVASDDLAADDELDADDELADDELADDELDDDELADDELADDELADDDELVDDFEDEPDGDDEDDEELDDDTDEDQDDGVATVATRRRIRRPGRRTSTDEPAAAVSTKTGTRVNRGPKIRPKSGIDAYFEVSVRRSTYVREFRGGVVTFFTMAYILVLNPIILSGADVTGAELPFASVAATTALVAGIMTILMGIVGRYPFAIATGLGLNALVAVLAATQLAWPEIMGLIVLEGLLITLLVVTGLRTAIFTAIPQQLKIAITVGIGLFLVLIGLVDAGFVKRVPDVAGTTVPVQLGTGFNLDGWPVLVFALGVLIMAVLVVRKVRGGILIGILATTVIAIIVEAVAKIGPAVGADGAVNPNGWQLTVPTLPDDLVSTPDLQLVGNFSLFGGFERIGALAAVLIVFTVLLADFFDTMGTTVGVAAEGNLLDDKGNLPGATRVLFVDSVAAAAGGASSVSSNTTYIESASGVADGARTGIASIVTGLLFLVAMFLSPIIGVIPSEAAAPALVIVGALMVSQIRNLDFGDMTVVIPALLTMVLMPFTYSITNGIGAGFISYVILRVATGKARHVHPLMWISAIAFAVYFFIEPIRSLFG